MTLTQHSRSATFRPQLTTIILLTIIAVTGVIVVAWFAGNGTITAIFQRLNEIQEHPPMWAMTPMMLENTSYSGRLA